MPDDFTGIQFTRLKVQRLSQMCANEYWFELCHSIRTASYIRNISGMYDDIKKAMKPKNIVINTAADVCLRLYHLRQGQGERSVGMSTNMNLVTSNARYAIKNDPCVA